MTERLVLAQYLLAQYLRDQAHWRLDAVDGHPARAARCVLALIDAAGYVRELPGDDPYVAALAVAGCFAGSSFEPGVEIRDFIRGWQYDDRPAAGPRDLLGALAARCAARQQAALVPPLPRAPGDGRKPQFASAEDRGAPQEPRAPGEGRRVRQAAARAATLRRGGRRHG
ncbi:MAG TPA: hypothetical protein VKD26_13670 [Streptosporangiaceae bacterium]|nr:hypothetical protein [Streptosporangiaceae bacterium]